MTAQSSDITPGVSQSGGRSSVMQAVIYMTAACSFFALMNVCVRLATESGLHVFQVAFFRNLFALLAMVPWLVATGFVGLHTKRLGAHARRSTLSLTAMVLWFSSVAFLPLAEATALNFTFPLFGTICAALILGEKVRARRWSATIIGFLGVLIILQPWGAQLAWESFLPIGAAFFMALSAVTVKQLSSTESAGTVVLYMNLFMTPISLVPALFFWQWPDWEIWLVLAALGVFAAVSHIGLTRAYALVDASFLQPLDYLRLPMIAILAYLFFSEVPSDWLWPGAAVIAGSTFYIARREAQLARVRRSAEQS